ncbi:MAG: 4-hydroxy-tetrahydrodipicolinate reductase, partial [Akkermansiaceae bacterium]|nr:4-hydroxy-tetrahydrodipicolinate reductase [Akkermansiaceae bacterium]
MPNLLVTGVSGRMGQAVIEAASQASVPVAATHDVGQDLDLAISKANCAIDFTIHSFTSTLVESALKHGTNLIIGTTGHTDAEREIIYKAAKSIRIVYAANYSVGVNTLFWLTRKAAQILTQDRFDIEVTEMHHKHKIDAPSGTARRLLEILNEETHTSYQNDIAHGRFGNIGPRKPREIGMHTLRGGDVVGDHTVLFAADGERVELTHKASSRLTFAAGAVRAASWLESQPIGL